MQTPAETYILLLGDDWPGKEVTTITDLKLSNTYLSEVPDELKLYTIPNNTKGKIQELRGTTLQLFFLFGTKYSDQLHQVTFSIRRRYFDKFFK